MHRWGLGIGDWGLGIGDWGLGRLFFSMPHTSASLSTSAQCPILRLRSVQVPNAQSLRELEQECHQISLT
ncbi:MAG: hypothetical protein HEQ35_30945 [Gloeotrichia echinulata IR180]